MGVARGAVAVADAIKPASAAAVARFIKLGVRPMLLTGDHPEAAEAVAREIGIDTADVRAEVLPGDKVDAIKALQDEGRTVAMVGDGVNDAAALAQADLGIAMGSGTDVAIEASDLTLVRSDLGAAVDAVRLARRTLSTIRGNLFWAFAYNVAALPLPADGLLNPILAGAAMAFSSVFVVTNSLRLRRFRPLSSVPPVLSLSARICSGSWVLLGLYPSQNRQDRADQPSPAVRCSWMGGDRGSPRQVRPALDAAPSVSPRGHRPPRAVSG